MIINNNKIYKNIETLENIQGCYIYSNVSFQNQVIFNSNNDTTYSLNFINCIFDDDIYLNVSSFDKNSTINIFNSIINGRIIINARDSLVAISLSFLKLNSNDSIKSNYDRLIIFGNHDKKTLFKKDNGYKEEYSNLNFIKQIQFNELDSKIELNVKNIPQYLGSDDDPPLFVGCEATACAATLSHILNKDIKKKDTQECMKKDMTLTKSFWEYFMGDIYKNGWGCMSPVSVDTIKEYFNRNNINEYDVFNLTGTPLYLILQFLKTNTPLIVWCTMGNEKEMYKVKYGSTIFNTDYGKMFWPGNDHSLSIVGYNLDKEEIYLADPEVKSSELRIRNIYEFENRFNELYSQSILIVKR